MDPSPYSDRTNAEVREQNKERLDAVLDEALEETFPASDPVAVAQPVANRRYGRERQRR